MNLLLLMNISITKRLFGMRAMRSLRQAHLVIGLSLCTMVRLSLAPQQDLMEIGATVPRLVTVASGT